ncbi:MAG: zinc metalloprotease HtpX [Chloroflexi bacterium]|nr:zinc metalloprotease HtpX [Chloroflexota bacterium]
MNNTIKTTLLLGVLTGLFLLIGDVLGGRQGMILALGFAVVTNLGAYWFSGDIALRMARAREVSPQEAPDLYSVVQDVATAAHLPMPKVAIIESPQPNAFATGRDDKHAVVAVTTGILSLLDRDELMGVLAHELGHVRNHDILIASIAATVAGAITMLARLAGFGMMFGGYGGRDRNGGGLEALAMLILAPIAAALIQFAISRSREYGADQTGAAIMGNPDALASALEKLDWASRRTPAMQVSPAAASLFIVNPLRGANLAGLFSTHPPIEERIKRLRAMQLRAVA